MSSDPPAMTGAVDVQVRKAVCKDIDSILRLDFDSGLTPWEAGDYEGYIEDAQWDLRVACDDSGVCSGFLLMRRVGDEAELLKIVVAQERRRSRIGRVLLAQGLLAARMAGCTHCFLEVRPSNAAAIALYRTNDFVDCGLRPGYYHDPPEAALLMRKDLTGKGEREGN